MKLHHDKHHATYVNNLNKALEEEEEAEAARDLPRQMRAHKAIQFNGGGHVNHSIFWTNLAPPSKGGGGEPSGALADAIGAIFGSFQQFKEVFSRRTAAIQGSGWGWLGYNCCSDSLTMCMRHNQDPCAIDCTIPLLGIDVWEHAYYIDYKNARPDYLKRIWEVVNWTDVGERYATARQKKKGHCS